MVIRKEGKLTIDWLAARKAIQSCCLKPTSLTQIYQHLLDIQFK